MGSKENGTMGERLQELLRISGYTQKELAEMAGVTEAAISHYIRGGREPRIEVVANLATALNTTTDYLILGTTEEDDFGETYRLVARGALKMSLEEKMELVRLLLKDDEGTGANKN